MVERSSELDYTEELETIPASNDFTAVAKDSAGNALEKRSEEAAVETTLATDDAEQIRGQIEETRSQLSETIDAIQGKLSIANITEQVKDQVSEQIGGAVESAKDALYDNAVNVVNSVGRSFRQIGKSDIAKKAQDTPWLLPAVGLGLGVIFVALFTGESKKSKKMASYRYKNSSRNDRDDEYENHESGRRNFRSDESNSRTARRKPESTTSAVYESVSNAASGALTSITGAASSAYEGVGGAAGAAYEGVGSAAGSAYEGVGSAASKTYEGIGKASSFAYETAEDLGGQMKKSYNQYIEENPLAVGAVALAVGAAVGFAIPLTKTENEYMGDLRDNVVDKAQSTAQDAIGSVKQMATDAQKLIVDEVKGQTAA